MYTEGQQLQQRNEAAGFQNHEQVHFGNQFQSGNSFLSDSNFNRAQESASLTTQGVLPKLSLVEGQQESILNKDKSSTIGADSELDSLNQSLATFDGRPVDERDGTKTSRDGAKESRDGTQSSRDGQQNPRDSQQNPRDGQQNPRDGEQSFSSLADDTEGTEEAPQRSRRRGGTGRGHGRRRSGGGHGRRRHGRHARHGGGGHGRGRGGRGRGGGQARGGDSGAGTGSGEGDDPGSEGQDQPGGADGGELQGRNNAEKAFNYLIGKGLTRAQAAGVVGNLIQENHNLDPRKPGDGGNSVGIAQWNGPRRRELMSYAREHGSSPYDLKTQLDFMWHELNGKEKRSLNALRRTSTPEEAARTFSRTYERPGNPMEGNRVRNAQMALTPTAGTPNQDGMRAAST